jgi:hypothetical protein
MSLDLTKLENVRKTSAKTTARCPACAEAGCDRDGNHLVIRADDRFGCVTHPGDTMESKKHRRRIFALCGFRGMHALAVNAIGDSPVCGTLDEPRTAELSVKPIKTNLLGRLGRLSETHARLSKTNESNSSVAHQAEYEKGVPPVPRSTAPVEPYRPLTEHERDILRRKGLENDPLIIEALNIFRGRIVG